MVYYSEVQSLIQVRILSGSQILIINNLALIYEHGRSYLHRKDEKHLATFGYNLERCNYCDSIFSDFHKGIPYSR